MTVRTPTLLASKRFDDDRGWFSETFNSRALTERGVADQFVQDNESFTARRGTIRGLHFQVPPAGQAKLVRVTQGRVLDVAVDVRRGSPTFGHFVSAELSEENGLQMFIPIGFAHGFCTLMDEVMFSYKVSGFYAPQHDAGLRWDDPDIAISWPFAPGEIHVSPKDAGLPRLKDFSSPFDYNGVPMDSLGPPL